MYHHSVLLKESVDLLDIKEGGTYVDVTFGGGGHTREILSRLDKGSVIAFDRDPDAQINLLDDERLTFVPRDFSFIESALTERQLLPLDGILADLGVSSHQFDTPERGFSFRFDGPLDMRMDRREGETAADLVNEADPEELIQIFRRYGEIPNAPKLVRELVHARTLSPIKTTAQLEHTIRNCVPPKRKSKYLAQVYQALRIVVNKELLALETLLLASLKLLKPEGRLVIISYHSLEDRLVKHFLRSGNLNGKVEKTSMEIHFLPGNSLPAAPFNQMKKKSKPIPERVVRV